MVFCLFDFVECGFYVARHADVWRVFTLRNHFYSPYPIYLLVYALLDLTEYYALYLDSSTEHAANIMQYGPQAPFGYPEPRPEQVKRIEFIVQYAEGDILDLGCDSGFILSECIGEVGIDLSRERLRAARYWMPYLTLVQALAEYLPFPQVFDTVIATELLEHVLSPPSVLREAHRVLKPNGKLIVTVPNEIDGKSHMNPEHLRHFTEDDLRQLLTEWFTIETFKQIEGEYPTWCLCCIRKS